MFTRPATFVSPEASSIIDESERKILHLLVASLHRQRGGVVSTLTILVRPILDARLLHLCLVVAKEMVDRRDRKNERKRDRYTSGGHAERKQKLDGKKARTLRNHAFVLSYLRDKQCLDCGVSEPLLFDFDHVWGDKYDNIANLTANAASIRTIVAEMQKCEVVCSNCHRRRTLTRQGTSFRLAESAASKPKIPPPISQADRGHKSSGIVMVGPWGDIETRRACGREYRAKKSVHSGLPNRTSRERSVARNQAFVLEYLSRRHCLDCGENDPVVLEFDHVRGVKLTEVSIFISGGRSLRSLQTEIDKCEVVCSNCHRRRTAKTRQYYRVRNAS